MTLVFITLLPSSSLCQSLIGSARSVGASRQARLARELNPAGLPVGSPASCPLFWLLLLLALLLADITGPLLFLAGPCKSIDLKRKLDRASC